MNKLRILHLVEFYHPSVGGMQTVVQQISERLAAQGHQVTVATTKIPERATKQLNGVTIKEFAIKGKASTIIQGDIKKFQDFIVNSEFDIVTLFAAQQWTVDLVLPLLDRLKAKKVFVPTGFSGLYDPVFGNYFENMRTWMKKFDINIFLSNDYRDINFARENDITKIKIIPNGADEREFRLEPAPELRSKLGIPTQNRILLLVGSHSGSKGHREAQEIISKMHSNQITLIIAATDEAMFKHGCKTACEKFAQDFNNSPDNKSRQRQMLVLPLDRATTIQAFQESTAFLFPSQIECSPIVLFESAAAAKPFFTNVVGNAQEIIDWTKGGILLPTNIDRNGYSHAVIEESAQIIDDYLAKPEKLIELGQNGRKAFEAKYSWAKIAEDYLTSYQDLIAKRFKPIVYPSTNAEIEVFLLITKDTSNIDAAVRSINLQSHLPKRVTVLDTVFNDPTIVENFKVPARYFYLKACPTEHILKKVQSLLEFSFLTITDSKIKWDSEHLAYQAKLYSRSPLSNIGFVYTRAKNQQERLIRGSVQPELLEGNVIKGKLGACLIRNEAYKTLEFKAGLGDYLYWDLILQIAGKYSVDHVYQALVSEDTPHLPKDHLEHMINFYKRWLNKVSDIQAANWGDVLANNALLAPERIGQLKEKFSDNEEKRLYPRFKSLRKFLLARLIITNIRKNKDLIKSSFHDLKKFLIILFK